MPNYVRNVIVFNTADGMKKFKERFMRGDKFSFNYVIKRPKSLDIEDGLESSRGLDVFLHSFKNKEARDSVAKNMNLTILDDKTYAEKYGNLDSKAIEKYRELGRIQVENYIKYGYANWYDWSCAKWGTKWDADVVDINDKSITFDTAWDAPMPVIKRIANCLRNRDADFVFEYADEDIGNNCGVYFFGKKYNKNGFGTDMSGSLQGEEVAKNIWGMQPRIVISKRNYLCQQ